MTWSCWPRNEDHPGDWERKEKPSTASVTLGSCSQVDEASSVRTTPWAAAFVIPEASAHEIVLAETRSCSPTPAHTFLHSTNIREVPAECWLVRGDTAGSCHCLRCHPGVALNDTRQHCHSAATGRKYLCFNFILKATSSRLTGFPTQQAAWAPAVARSETSSHTDNCCSVPEPL